MRTFILATVSLFALASVPAIAATVEGGTADGSSAVLIAAKRVCDGPYVLTAEAFAACQSGTFPDMIADGSRFVARGIGAEFNTLIRQLPAATAAVEPAN